MTHRIECAGLQVDEALHALLVNDIAPGTGHWVVVPKEAPDLRRHWHRGCWLGRK